MATTAKFLTNAPTSQKIRSGEFAELSVLTYTLSGDPFGRIIAYRTGGATATYDTATLAPVKNRITLPVAVPGAETFANVERIGCSILIGSGIRTEVRYFYPDKTTRKNPVRLAWLNLLGGIDRYTFTGYRSRQIAAEQETFEKELAFPFSREDYGEAVLRATTNDEFTVASDFEPEATFLWLSEILSSPSVWIESGGYHIPIIRTSKAFPVEDAGVFQLQFKFRLANKRVSQNG